VLLDVVDDTGDSTVCAPGAAAAAAAAAVVVLVVVVAVVAAAAVLAAVVEDEALLVVAPVVVLEVEVDVEADEAVADGLKSSTKLVLGSLITICVRLGGAGVITGAVAGAVDDTVTGAAAVPVTPPMLCGATGTPGHCG
jgi:hypothetical protein